MLTRDEERARFVPLVWLQCPWASLLLQTLIADAHFMGGFMRRMRPIKAVVGPRFVPMGRRARR